MEESLLKVVLNLFQLLIESDRDDDDDDDTKNDKENYY